MDSSSYLNESCLFDSSAYLWGCAGRESAIWYKVQVSEVCDQMHWVLDPPLSQPISNVCVARDIQSVKSEVGPL